MPAAAQRHLARGPALHVALGAAHDLDDRLARVGRLERALERAGDAEAGERQRLLHPFPQRAGGTRIAVLELAGEQAQLLERASVIVERPGSPQSLLDRLPVALGQMVGARCVLFEDEVGCQGRIGVGVPSSQGRVR
jgi:hypothetical protein